MTCVDQPMIRRGRRRAGFVSVFGQFVRALPVFSHGKYGQVEDLNDHMMRDIGFFDGRATEASMRRASECLDRLDQF